MTKKEDVLEYAERRFVELDLTNELKEYHDLPGSFNFFKFDGLLKKEWAWF